MPRDSDFHLTGNRQFSAYSPLQVQNTPERRVHKRTHDLLQILSDLQYHSNSQKCHSTFLLRVRSHISSYNNKTNIMVGYIRYVSSRGFVDYVFWLKPYILPLIFRSKSQANIPGRHRPTTKKHLLFSISAVMDASHSNPSAIYYELAARTPHWQR